MLIIYKMRCEKDASIWNTGFINERELFLKPVRNKSDLRDEGLADKKTIFMNLIKG